MIYLDDKAPGDVVDYNLDMSEFIPEGFTIDHVLVQVVASGDGESPVTLEAFDASTQPLAEGDPLNVCILFWLRGGTAGQRYRGLIEMSDNQGESPSDRVYYRAFQVEVKNI